MSESPEYLKARGRELWAAMSDGVQLSGDERILLHEACRLTDRLDKLDAILNGKDRSWLTLDLELLREPGEPIVLVVDKCLGEARQQAVALNQLVKGLRDARTERLKSVPVETPDSKADTLAEKMHDELAARRVTNAS